MAENGDFFLCTGSEIKRAASIATLKRIELWNGISQKLVFSLYCFIYYYQIIVGEILINIVWWEQICNFKMMVSAVLEDPGTRQDFKESINALDRKYTTKNRTNYYKQ